jgi:hypothetical protein
VPSPANGFVYVCTVGGTAFSSPPVWPTVIGATVTESGGPTWSCYAPVGVGLSRFAYHASSHGASVLPATLLGGGARLTTPVRVHHGATVAQVNFYFFIGNAHTAGLPASFPQLRVLRLDMAGNAVPLCTSPTTAGWQGNGWVNAFGTALPATPSLYYMSGTEWGLGYPCDAGTVIDTSKYAYVGQVQDESGGNAYGGNTFFAASALGTLIADIRPQ